MCKTLEKKVEEDKEGKTSLQINSRSMAELPKATSLAIKIPVAFITELGEKIVKLHMEAQKTTHPEQREQA